MKKLFTLLLAFLLPLFSHADDSGTCGDGLTYTYEESTQTLTITGNGAMSNYSYNESPWISYKTDIKAINIAEGGTSIGDYSFYGCSGLTSITISKSVTSIGKNAFYGCSGLTTITIPESVTSIGEGAFYQCNSLEKVTYLSPSPFILDKAIFPTQFKTGGTLYIPAGTRQTYVERGWSGSFFNIVEMEEGEPIWLTIMDAELGHTKLKCESGKSYPLQFEPSDGWHIHSVTYRGTDVTDWLTEENVFTTPAILQSAELNITYAEGSTRVMNVKAESDIRVLVNDDYIVVRGVDAGTLIHVYDLNGRQISSTKAGDGETRIAVNTNEHVLLIKVGDQVVKVAR